MKKLDIKMRKLRIINDDTVELEIATPIAVGDVIDDPRVREFEKSLDELGWKLTKESFPQGVDFGVGIVKKQAILFNKKFKFELRRTVSGDLTIWAIMKLRED